MKLAPTNSNSLQPIPAGVSANISQNVNATSTYNPNDQNSTDLFSSSSDQTETAVVTTPVSTASSNHSTNIYYWSIFVILLIIFILLSFRKLSKNR